MSTTRRRPSTTPARIVAAALVVSAIGFGAAACGGEEDAKAPSTSAASSAEPTGGALVDVEAFAAGAEQPGVTVVDVRTPAEFAAGHLEGAVNIDVQDPGFADAVAALDPAGTYAVYCQSGNRSGVAVSYLVDHGFGSVYHLGGGIGAWQAAGLPITTG